MARDEQPKGSYRGNRPEESPGFVRQDDQPVPHTREKVDSQREFPF